MKHIILSTVIASIAVIGSTNNASAQITPQPSPLAKIEQKIGLTDVSVVYSRPSKKDRVVFGDLVPFGEYWRTGANENTKITTTDAMIFGKDTLKAGTYALFTKPGKESWEVYFYKDYSNWGTPEEWKESNVAVKVVTRSIALMSPVESFTISIDNVEMGGAKLGISWDKTSVSVPFTVPTDSKVVANIKKTMAGPTANDYNSSAQYYLTAKKDLKQALDWSVKATELRPDAFWMFRTKSLIQAELNDKTGAIASAKTGLALAEKAQNPDYVKMFNDSIKEWSK